MYYWRNPKCYYLSIRDFDCNYFSWRRFALIICMPICLYDVVYLMVLTMHFVTAAARHQQTYVLFDFPAVRQSKTN